MPVESAADRASFFDTDEFGTAARFVAKAGGDPVITAIIFDIGRESPFEVEIGSSGSGLRAAYAEQRAWLNADDLPAVAIGDTVTPGIMDGALFTAGDTTYRIASKPVLDESGGVWHVDLEAA